MGFRIDLGGGVLDPRHTCRHDVGLGTAQLASGSASASHEGQQGLVDVLFARFDDRDVGLASFAQPGGDAEPGVAPSDDDDGVVQRMRARGHSDSLLR